MCLVKADSKIGRGAKDIILMKSNDQNIWCTAWSKKMKNLKYLTNILYAVD